MVVVQLPIAFLLVFVIGVFFQRQTDSPGNQAFGLMCAIIGLMFFMVKMEHAHVGGRGKCCTHSVVGGQLLRRMRGPRP